MPHQFFPEHKPYENYIYRYQRYTVADDDIINSSDTEIHFKQFMCCSEQPEGYVNLEDIVDSLSCYRSPNDASVLEYYSITDMGNNKFYVELPVWDKRFY